MWVDIYFIGGWMVGWVDGWIGRRSIAINIYWAHYILVTDRKRNAG
jgi:hypothetical protein